MRIHTLLSLFFGLLLAAESAAVSEDYDYRTIRDPRKLTDEQSAQAAANYQRYCSLCHGADRQGYVNDHAPSLRSKSLFSSGVPHEVLRPIQYGRDGTPMGGYLDEVGGPLTLDETWDLTYWLFWQADTKRVRITKDLVQGDATRGADLYAENCTECHGVNGEGVTAPALGNPSALSHNSDEFIRYAIREGRDGTPMEAWKDRLTSDEIDGLTAFLRSRAMGWQQSKVVLRDVPMPDQYVINKNGADPEFDLQDGLYVSAADLLVALEEKKRMVLLDTRVTSVWQRVHIEGAVPLPYYVDLDDVVGDLPKDVQIVAYCSCPRAAADDVISRLRSRGFTRTATMYEGIFGWMNMGYPVINGKSE
ncbi:MAG: c-type cytochrome [Kordiimonadaceae bacterium]|nr:c-type cytochrome [Kordiimonadaceae bacterium]MBO6567833.1 c-type cytochrome [Kordiimonadaceae bacterium]MBO6964437.1 c-type cytochrome [Kordiimonadaceae bacterium]